MSEHSDKALCSRRGCGLAAVYHVLDEGYNYCAMHLPEKDKGRKINGEKAVVRSDSGFALW